MIRLFKKQKKEEVVPLQVGKFELSSAWDEYSNLIKETQQIINDYLDSTKDKFESMDEGMQLLKQELAEITKQLEEQGVDLDKYRNMTSEELLADIKKDLERLNY